MKPLTVWQRAAALATEGACLIPYLLVLFGNVVGLSLPPYWLPNLPLVVQRALPTALASLLYGILHAPLQLWRTAYYARLCAVGEALPSLRPTGRALAAIGWRGRLWLRRAVAGALFCAPSALAFGYGQTVSRNVDTAAVQPALWLAIGTLALLVGVVAAAVWQYRYALAPYFLLRGEPPAAVLPLSARAMRGHVGDYVNFIGGELPRLVLCLLLVPTLWILPAFRRRRTALLLSWMPPDR
jgi:hypothetical protein